MHGWKAKELGRASDCCSARAMPEHARHVMLGCCMLRCSSCMSAHAGTRTHRCLPHMAAMPCASACTATLRDAGGHACGWVMIMWAAEHIAREQESTCTLTP